MSAVPGRTIYDRLRSLGAQGDANARIDAGVRGIVMAQEFGAIGDGGSHPLSDYYATLAEAQVDFPCATALTDERDWAAIQTMCDNVTGVQLYTPGAIYYVNRTIVAGPYADFVCDGDLYYTGPHDQPCLIVGSATVQANWLYVRATVRSATQSDWSDENYVGVQLVNLYSSFVNIDQADGFTIGVQCLGQGNGFSYNQVNLGDILNNKVGLDLSNVTYAAAAGWCNGNEFSGGRFRCYSSLSGAGDRWGIRIKSQDVSPYYNNSLLFINPSFELGSAASGYPLRIEHGTQVRMIAGRNEGNHPTISGQVLNNSHSYDLDWAYGTATIVDTGAYPNGRETHRKLQCEQLASRLIWQSGAVHKTWCYYDGATKIHVPRCQFGASSTNATYSNLQIAAMNAAYLELDGTRGLGVRIVCHSVRRFCVKLDVATGYGGRVVIRCYDAAGAILAGTTPVYVQFAEHRTLSTYASFGGSYRSGADSEADLYFQLRPEVFECDVFVSGGTANCRVRSMSVFAVDGDKDASAYVGYEQGVPGANIGSAVPSAGTWAVGRRVWDDTPSSGGTEGWVCTVAGTPGTWKAFGVVA